MISLHTKQVKLDLSLLKDTLVYHLGIVKRLVSLYHLMVVQKRYGYIGKEDWTSWYLTVVVRSSIMPVMGLTKLHVINKQANAQYHANHCDVEIETEVIDGTTTAHCIQHLVDVSEVLPEYDPFTNYKENDLL